MQIFRNTKQTRGFTLVEMLVAVSVFVVVMVISSGAILSILDGTRKTRSVQLVMDNLNFALENMARTMRTGSLYHCDFGETSPPRTESNDCPPNGSDDEKGAPSIVFEEAHGNRLNDADNYVYRLNTGTNQIERSTNTGGTFIPITAPNITITRLRFYVLDSNDLDPPVVNKGQPRIIMVVRGTAGENPKTQTTFNLQTVISQRLPDI